MPVRRTTSTCSTGESAAATASSTAAFSETAVPRRYCPSAVITTRGLRVADPGPQRLRREPGEDDAVGQPQPRAGQHREHRLRDHRQVDRHPIAGLQAERNQRVRRLGHLCLQLRVGDGAGIPRLTLPMDGDRVPDTRPRHAGPHSCSATFSSPSANHLACGASDQSNTWVNGVAHDSRFACSAQNASGSAAARSYASRGQIRVRPRTPPTAETSGLRFRGCPARPRPGPVRWGAGWWEPLTGHSPW